MKERNTREFKPYRLKNFISKDKSGKNNSPVEVTDPPREAKKAVEDKSLTSVEEAKTPVQPKRARKRGEQTFHFFFKRTCFRTMVYYLKRIFTPFLHEQSLIDYPIQDGGTEVVRVNNALSCFAIAHFPRLISEMKSEESQKEFLLYLKIILFSHRYQKS